MATRGAPPLHGRCSDPRIGAHLDDYCAGRLLPADRDAFEAHYFDCPACAAELGMRQAIVAALEEGRRAARPKRRWAWAAAVALVVTGGSWLALNLGRPIGEPAVEPFEVTLEAARRSPGVPPRAPAGRPLRLVLAGDFSERRDASFDLRLEGPDGTARPVGAAPERPAPYRLEWILPSGFADSGRHTAVLEERLPGGQSTIRRFEFEVEP